MANDGDVPATVHWHGLRLENRYDGVPHETQQPIPIGGGFTYRVRFPDEGLYWYHPHIREDYAQDMGLSGNIVVEPAEARYWSRSTARSSSPSTTCSSRTAGSPPTTARPRPRRDGPLRQCAPRERRARVVARRCDRDEVVRFYLTNTANTRVFNLGDRRRPDEARRRRQRPVRAGNLRRRGAVAPSERAVVDVLFDARGRRRSSTGRRSGRTARARRRRGRPTALTAAAAFPTLRRAPELEAERARIAAEIDARAGQDPGPVAEMDDGRLRPRRRTDGAALRLPDEPRGRQRRAGALPEMRDEADPDRVSFRRRSNSSTTGRGGDRATPAHSGTTATATTARHGHGHDAAGSIEWEDTMEAVNRRSNPANMRWMLVDRETGKANAAIDWSFKVGDRVKIRLVNEMDSDHPMHHPFHIHGAGRFLVLTRDGSVEPNLVWKDTVLVRTGEVVDILLDVSNPGLWMAHCHIAEHAESGMMFSFRVAR